MQVDEQECGRMARVIGWPAVPDGAIKATIARVSANIIELPRLWEEAKAVRQRAGKIQAQSDTDREKERETDKR